MSVAEREAPSPCVGICRLDESGRHCLGCGRTIDEIAGWSSFDETARIAVLDRLPTRLASFADRPKRD